MPADTPRRPSEFELIARFFAPFAAAEGGGLLDDVACFSPEEGNDIILTSDSLVAGSHFFADDDPASIARKALGVNISDLAAKGAEPRGFLLNLALPGDWTVDWMERFAAGLRQASDEWRCPLFGGDTVRSDSGLWLSVTAVGVVPKGSLSRRGGALPGDMVLVSGTIGDAALGLELWRREREGGAAPSWSTALSPEDRAFLKDRYWHPRPRLALYRLIRRFAHASMDISDGLVGDFLKLAAASGLGGRLELKDSVFSDAVRRAVAVDPALIEPAVTGGDDYELLLTVAEKDVAECLCEAGALGERLSVVGRVDAEGLPVTVLYDGRPFVPGRDSFRHF